MKKNYLNELQEINSYIRRINEGIDFEEPQDEEKPCDCKPGEECVNGECVPEKEAAAPAEEEIGEEIPLEQGADIDQLTEVDEIREIALKGMIKLCKNPNDPNYQALKKVFQFVDKAAEDKNKEIGQ